MKNRLQIKVITTIATAVFSAALAGCSMIPEDILTEQVSDTAQSLASRAIEETGDKVKEIAQEAAKEAAQQAAENAQQAFEDAKQQVLEEAENYADDPDKALNAITATTPGTLTSAADLNIAPKGDKDGYYSFTYDGREYMAIHKTDHWKIIDSCDINNEADMHIICQALIDLHQIHGKDMVSYRTADDMVYEWEVHNLAYLLVEDDDPMKERLKDVDFDPQDQGCTFDEIYYNHTGKELDLGSIFGG
jgi:hypothetical protein